jgi:hypothetical protein
MHLLQQGGQVLHYVRYSPPEAPGSPCRHACSRCCRFAAVVAAPTAVAKVILSAPTPGAIVGTPMSVAKKAKALKESAPEMLDESAVC